MEALVRKRNQIVQNLEHIQKEVGEKIWQLRRLANQAEIISSGQQAVVMKESKVQIERIKQSLDQIKTFQSQLDAVNTEIRQELEKIEVEQNDKKSKEKRQKSQIIEGTKPLDEQSLKDIMSLQENRFWSADQVNRLKVAPKAHAKVVSFVSQRIFSQKTKKMEILNDVQGSSFDPKQFSEIVEKVKEMDARKIHKPQFKYKTNLLEPQILKMAALKPNIEDERNKFQRRINQSTQPEIPFSAPAVETCQIAHQGEPYAVADENPFFKLSERLG